MSKRRSITIYNGHNTRMTRLFYVITRSLLCFLHDDESDIKKNDDQLKSPLSTNICCFHQKYMLLAS